MSKLAGKIALVTGAGRGIGRATAIKLASEGASLVVNDLDEAPASETATQTDDGLIVPVLRDAGSHDLWNAAAEIARLANAARDGSAKREELSGSTITLTSLGALGGIVSTPVVNRPELAIVGVNRIVERPVWIDNQVEPRKLMNLSSSFDHRIIDGIDAARFIQAIKRRLETPVLLSSAG